jgi:hypothetical protein
MIELQGEAREQEWRPKERDQLANWSGVPLVGSWPLIRRSAWKVNSTNFAFTVFSEVAPAPCIRSYYPRCATLGGTDESRPSGERREPDD